MTFSSKANYLWVLIAPLIAFSQMGCATGTNSISPSTPEFLRAAELQRTLLDNSLYRHGRRLFRVWEYASRHSEDGSITARIWWSDGHDDAAGTWEVTPDDLYCRTWSNNWGNGKRGCFRVHREAATLVFDHVSGSRGDADRYTYLLLPGNPHNL